MLLTRRNIITGCGSIVGLALVGGAGAALDGDAELLRPPGGQDETRFIANCLRCDRCRSVCPQGCISIAHIEDGIVNCRTPYIDFHKGACDFCNKCIDACPNEALVSFDKDTERIGLAVVDQNECLAFRSTGCKVCFEKCPYEAITLEASNYPVVNESLCNGCGVCENVCPSASFGSYSGSDKRGINVEKKEGSR